MRPQNLINSQIWKFHKFSKRDEKKLLFSRFKTFAHFQQIRATLCRNVLAHKTPNYRMLENNKKEKEEEEMQN